MRILRRLAEDGLEDLGTIELGTTLVAGDPSALVTPVGSGTWFGTGVRRGTWQLLGRPWDQDPDLLQEVVLVHTSVLEAFYTAYDEAVPVATLPLPRRRVVLLDGALRTDPGVLRSMVEPDELPWVSERGCVVGGIGDWPAQVIATRGPETVLVAVALDAPPAQVIPTEPFSRDKDEDDS